MNKVAEIIARTAIKYWSGSVAVGREVRLLIPGLTKRIAEDVHRLLRDKFPRTYLVVGRSDEPSHATGRLHADALTSCREGSMIVVVNPGELAYIPDSIRGTGGTVRSPAFSEEWPWIDDGNESFRFAGPFLDQLLVDWTDDDVSRGWLRHFISLGLVPASSDNPDKATLLLDKLLAGFASDPADDATRVTDRFLYHCGVPRVDGEDVDCEKFINEVVRTIKKVLDACTEVGKRRLVLARVDELFPLEPKRSILRSAIDSLFDGLARPSSGAGVLGLSAAVKDRLEYEAWWNLDCRTLRLLFDVESYEASVLCEIECARAVQDRKNVATFHGEKLTVRVTYSAGALGEEASCGIRILKGQTPLCETTCELVTGVAVLVLDTAKIDNYQNRIPLKVQLLINGDERAWCRVYLHLCGDKRPGFMLFTPGFHVADPVELAPVLARETDYRLAATKVILAEPATTYLFAEPTSVCPVLAYDDDLVETRELNPGIHAGNKLVDPAGVPMLVTGTFARGVAARVVEIDDVSRGEYTLEDELRVFLTTGSKSKLRPVLDVFTREDAEPYTLLGGLDAASARSALAATMEGEPDGWMPVLLNMFRDPSAPAKLQQVGGIVRCESLADAERFTGTELRDDLHRLVETYAAERKAVINAVKTALPQAVVTLDRPLYAGLPLFLLWCREAVEEPLVKYLRAYVALLEYLASQREALHWHEVFLIAHLDCAVNWDSGNELGTFFLVGPWHPVTLAKRFMVQAALVRASLGFLGHNGPYAFNQLGSLLGRANYYRWSCSVAREDSSVVPAYMAATNDPGWHVGFQVGVGAGRDLRWNDVAETLYRRLGIAIRTFPLSSGPSVASFVRDFTNAYPTRRSVSVRLGSGYKADSVVEAVDGMLFDNDDPHELARQLQGGVRLYFTDRVDGDTPYTWREPPLLAHHYDSDDSCFSANHIDMQVPAVQRAVTFAADTTHRSIPRGDGDCSAFSVPLMYTSAGAEGTPTSIAIEAEAAEDKLSSIREVGDAFVAALRMLGRVAGQPLRTVRALALPRRMRSEWIVLPGVDVDPAVLVEYVAGGVGMAEEERALWDYRISIGRECSDYYVVSRIPPGFRNVLSGSNVLRGADIAGAAIKELGEIGIAIGSEAMKAGRRALGVLGVLAAVRIFRAPHRGAEAPIRVGGRNFGFILPVDSFGQFFAAVGHGSHPGRRADLIAMQLYVPEDNSPVLVSGCAIECKYVSGLFSEAAAENALGQARETFDVLRALCLNALGLDGVPARLALVDIVSFGLRVGVRNSVELCIAQKAVESLLRGNFSFIHPDGSAVLFSTECGLDRDQVNTDQGIWVRLAPGGWPVTGSEDQLGPVYDVLKGVFAALVPKTGTQTRAVDTASTGQPATTTTTEGQVQTQRSPATSEPSVRAVTQLVSGTETSPSFTGLLVGAPNLTSRWGIVGRTSDGRQLVALDLDNPKAIGVFGYMGSGKSYLLGVLIENALMEFPGINVLRAPIAVVVFNYRRQSTDRFELASMARPNPDPSAAKRLSEEYHASPAGLTDLQVLCLPGSLNQARSIEYGGIPAAELMFDPASLTVEDWELLMGEPGSEAIFARTIRNALQDLHMQGGVVTQERLEAQVQSSGLAGQSLNAAKLRFDFVRRYVSAKRGVDFSRLVKPGRELIIDLRQPLFNKDDALRFFLVCAGQISKVQGQFNRMVIFDEAHEYISTQFEERMMARIRQMRHEGTTYVFASQDVGSIPLGIRRFVTTRFVFDLGTNENVNDLRVSAPEFRDHQLTNMVAGTCWVQSDKSLRGSFNKPRLISVRPRLTEHGGASRIFHEPTEQ